MNEISHLLRCIRCRRNQSQYSSVLTSNSEGVECPHCKNNYPSVDGIPILLFEPRAKTAWIDDEYWKEDPSDACRIISEFDPESNDSFDSCLFSTYAVAHYPTTLADGFIKDQLIANLALRNILLDAMGSVSHPDGPALELGCGPGGYADIWGNSESVGTVVASDIKLAPLRLARKLLTRGEAVIPWRNNLGELSPMSVVRNNSNLFFPIMSDALDPPFAAESFSLVAALNLLDSVSEPWLLLGQMDALLKPDGLLVIALPYQYSAKITSKVGWLDGPPALRKLLAGNFKPLAQLNYEVLLNEEALPWALPLNHRNVNQYLNHLVIARKR